jgi:hypothetical protein
VRGEVKNEQPHPEEARSAVSKDGSWFETRGVAALLTMRVILDLILRSGVFAASRRVEPH